MTASVVCLLRNSVSSVFSVVSNDLSSVFKRHCSSTGELSAFNSPLWTIAPL